MLNNLLGDKLYVPKNAIIDLKVIKFCKQTFNYTKMEYKSEPRHLEHVFD
jgi:hypothetical protein